MKSVIQILDSENPTYAELSHALHGLVEVLKASALLYCEISKLKPDDLEKRGQEVLYYRKLQEALHALSNQTPDGDGDAD